MVMCCQTVVLVHLPMGTVDDRRAANWDKFGAAQIKDTKPFTAMPQPFGITE